MKIRYTLVFLAMVFAVSACAGRMDYTTLDVHMKTRKCTVAAGYVEENRGNYGRNQELLFYVDSATIHMLCGEYEKSNEYFHRAEELAEELWTKSITKEAASFLLNDYTIPYAGEDFERALINLFSAINYAVLGNYDEALVECRRLDANLSMFNQKYEEKNVYKEDAFGRYLSGIIYESSGNIDDAFIDYYKAVQVYRDYGSDYGTNIPTVLIEDLFRLGEAAGRLEELKDLEGYRETTWLSFGETKMLGKIVLIHLSGKSPVKQNNKIHIPTRRGPITVAFPRYAVRPPSCRESELLAYSEAGQVVAGTELVEDINHIAVKNLNDRKGRLVAKEVARVALKQGAIELATNNIEDEDTRQMAKVLLNVVNMAIERADTRSWRTLPGEIYLTRVYVPEGKYSVYVRSCGNQEEVLPFLNLKSGETKFVLFDTMY